MNGAIAYDLTRIFLGPLFPTPRGIDRVDFLLARHLLRCRHRTFLGILPTPWGIRVYDADRVERVLQRLEELWAETKDPRDDPAYGRVVSALMGQRKKETEITRNRLSPFHKGRRMTRLLSYTGFSVGRSAIFSVPKNSIYVNVGHYSLAIPAFMSWLGKRRDVKPILMLHDTIPLDRPELVSPQGVRHHRRMVRSVARFGAGLIVTTGHARETILQALAAEGRSNIKTLGVALPLAEAFDSPAKADPLLERVPYFVVCGSCRAAQESSPSTRRLATALCFAGGGASPCCDRFAWLARWVDTRSDASLRDDAWTNSPCPRALYTGYEVAYCRIARPAIAVLRRRVRAANH